MKKKNELLRLPVVFFDDHESRDLPTPAVIYRSVSHVWVDPADEALAELQDDARYYSDPHGPHMEMGFRSSARATVRAIAKVIG